MNRRQAIKTTFTAAALASVLRPGMLAAQETPQKPAPVEGNTLYLNPATGADTNSGARDSRLRTLAEAARRVNQTEGAGPMTVILSEEVYAVGETATFKPERRTLTKTDRLTIRAEVLPDDPDWHTGRMPTLIHTLPLTGPRAGGLIHGSVRPEDERLLESCYRACLDLAAQHQDIKVLAFCCISTGEFRFPKVPAAQIAVRTVCRWLQASGHHLHRVVFNVFTQEDHDVYAALFRQT